MGETYNNNSSKNNDFCAIKRKENKGGGIFCKRDK